MRDANGAWLESEGDKGEGLVKDLFGEVTAQAKMGEEGGRVCPYTEQEVIRWVWKALSGIKNKSAAGIDRVG